MTYNPYRHLAGLTHITFGIVRLPAGRGWWLPQKQAIVLDDRLTRSERRTVLAHELVHAEQGDTQVACCGPGTDRIARRREQAADRIAANRLIALDDLADKLLWTVEEQELAEDLDVDVATVRTRLRYLTDDEKNYIDDRLRDAEGRIA